MEIFGRWGNQAQRISQKYTPSTGAAPAGQAEATDLQATDSLDRDGNTSITKRIPFSHDEGGPEIGPELAAEIRPMRADSRPRNNQVFSAHPQIISQTTDHLNGNSQLDLQIAASGLAQKSDAAVALAKCLLKEPSTETKAAVRDEPSRAVNRLSDLLSSTAVARSAADGCLKGLLGGFGGLTCGAATGFAIGFPLKGATLLVAKGLQEADWPSVPLATEALRWPMALSMAAGAVVGSAAPFASAAQISIAKTVAFSCLKYWAWTTAGGYVGIGVGALVGQGAALALNTDPDTMLPTTRLGGFIFMSLLTAANVDVLIEGLGPPDQDGYVR